jgi:hypothetical protein
MRRKKTMENKEPKTTTSGSNIEPVKVEPTKAPEFNDIDIAVSLLMGLDEPKPFSSDRNLVNDMVKLAREKGIKLPRFTSDPLKISTAIAEHKAEDTDNGNN